MLVLAVLLTTACQPHQVNLTPAPMAGGPATFSEAAAPQRTTTDPWWAVFGDDKLDTLMDEAMGRNLDVVQAMARLAQAEALTRRAEAERLPEVGLAADLRKEWLDGDAQQRRVMAGGSFAWEVDLFNRLGADAMARRSERAARADEVDGARLLLSAEVAGAYFDAVEQGRQLALLRQQIDADQSLLDLTEMRHAAGLTASVDVLQQSSVLAETESLVPLAEAALRVAENRLDVLLGQAPDAVARVAATDRFTAAAELPFVGVPSDLLLNRPDLRAARNLLIAADADIGAAIADRLPRITLSGGQFYTDGPELSGPTSFLLGALVQPLLDWGARKATVARNRAVYTEKLAAFSQAYLEAIEETENVLYLERKQRVFLDRLERRRMFLARTVDETRDRYTNGLTDFLPVLNAIKELQQTERILLRQQRVLLGFRIQLHRAVGGRVTPI